MLGIFLEYLFSQGMNLKNIVPIRIEPGLFEPLSWQSHKPTRCPFIDPYTLQAAGFNIDLIYSVPLMYYEQLKLNETIQDFYQRSYYVTKTLVDIHAVEGI